MKTIALAVLSLTLLASCAKQDPIPTPDPNPAGKGGNATLLITPKHHGNLIDSCTIYVKYNATEAPATYDDSMKVTMRNGQPTAIFPNLKNGNYYLYGYGWDPSIQDTVLGGAPYTIASQDSLFVNLPVTEGD